MEDARLLNATGGIRYTKHGPVPLGDEEWLDLGDAYVFACAALGVPTKVQESEEEL